MVILTFREWIDSMHRFSGISDLILNLLYQVSYAITQDNRSLGPVAARNSNLMKIHIVKECNNCTFFLICATLLSNRFILFLLCLLLQWHRSLHLISSQNFFIARRFLADWIWLNRRLPGSHESPGRRDMRNVFQHYLLNYKSSISLRYCCWIRGCNSKHLSSVCRFFPQKPQVGILLGLTFD